MIQVPLKVPTHWLPFLSAAMALIQPEGNEVLLPGRESVICAIVLSCLFKIIIPCLDVPTQRLPA